MTAARIACGRLANSGARTRMVSSMPAAITRRRELALVAGGFTGGHGADAGIDCEAAGQAAREVATAEGDELLIGVDAVAVAVGEGTRGGDRFGKRQEDDAGRAGGEVGQVTEADLRAARACSALRRCRRRPRRRPR